MIERPCPIVFRTHGPGFHFFGYYDKSPIDASGRRMLTHCAHFDWKRMPEAEDVVDIGYFELDTGSYYKVAETRAWNWQQGSMLRWLPGEGDRIVFNDREGSRAVSRIVDLGDGSTRTLSFPVYSVHPSGRSAVCANYARLAYTHRGYHYEGVSDPRFAGERPAGDGLFRLDLESDEVERIVPLETLLALQPISSMRGASHYVEHAMFNPDGSRFCFLHRWMLPDGGTYARFLSADEFGRDLRVLHDTGGISHFGWRGNREIVAWARPASRAASLRRSRFLSQFLLKPLLPVYHRLVSPTGALRQQLTGDTYLLFDEATGRSAPLCPAIRFPDDGHNTWRPGDDRWMLTDTYEDEEFHRHLLLYDHERRELLRIGRFYSVRETCSTGYRCDLHPRWDGTGNRVVIDSTHEGERQMYVIDVSEVVGAESAGT